MWDPDQIDALGSRLTDAEVEELKEVEAQRHLPDYMRRVDQLIATKMVAYGIATYDEIFPGLRLVFMLTRSCRSLCVLKL